MRHSMVIHNDCHGRQYGSMPVVMIFLLATVFGEICTVDFTRKFIQEIGLLIAPNFAAPLQLLDELELRDG